jgi:hypothetical protein
MESRRTSTRGLKSSECRVEFCRHENAGRWSRAPRVASVFSMGENLLRRVAARIHRGQCVRSPLDETGGAVLPTWAAIVLFTDGQLGRWNGSHETFRLADSATRITIEHGPLIRLPRY